MVSDSTCWNLIEGGARGRAEDRAAFASRYEPVLRAYLGARWRRVPHLLEEVDDAVQEIFVECFRRGGILARAEPGRPGGFRAFLYGAARNVALRCERQDGRARSRRAPGEFDPDRLAAEETTLSRVFDQSWATAILQEAGELQAACARARADSGNGDEIAHGAPRRVELLRLRFHEGLPIRDIAQRWEMDVQRVHREYARARQEFKAALFEVLALHFGGSAAELEERCLELMGLLGS